MQHRPNRPVPGRHRRDTTLHGYHRAPSTPRQSQALGSRGLNAVLTAALVAGVGVASASAATASSARSRAEAPPVAAHTEIAPTLSPFMDDDAVFASPVLSSVHGLRKDRPVLPALRALRKDKPVLPALRTLRKDKPVLVLRWVNPLPEASVTSCFGMRWGRLHAGVDLAAANGTPIRAAGAGIVVAAGPAAGYGNAVLIQHSNGYLTHYGHMSVTTVIAGQKVLAGQQIGDEGSTGHSTGPHLHFEVHQGQYKNPIEPTRWMHEHGVDIPGCVTLTVTPKPKPKP